MGEKDGGVDSGMDLDGRGVDGGVDGAMHAAGGRERRGLMAHGWESGTVCFGRPAGPYRLRRPTGRFSLASGTISSTLTANRPLRIPPAASRPADSDVTIMIHGNTPVCLHSSRLRADTSFPRYGNPGYLETVNFVNYGYRRTMLAIWAAGKRGDVAKVRRREPPQSSSRSA